MGGKTSIDKITSLKCWRVCEKSCFVHGDGAHDDARYIGKSNQASGRPLGIFVTLSNYYTLV